MIRVRLTCYDKGFELDTVMYLAGLPSTGDIVNVGDKEYEVSHKTFTAAKDEFVPAIPRIRLKIQ